MASSQQACGRAAAYPSARHVLGRGAASGSAERVARLNGKQVLDTTREMIAYGLIGLLLVVAVPWIGVTMTRRKRERLRRRGIKTYGH